MSVFALIKPYLRKAFFLFSLLIGISHTGVYAGDAPVHHLNSPHIGEITFQGLRRIEKDAVAAKVESQLGKPIDVDQVKLDIHALHQMGYFDDISTYSEIMANGQLKLIYAFVEKPAISKIEFVGNERLSSSDLKEVIKVKPWSILDLNIIHEDIKLLQKHYEDKGYFIADISYSIRPSKRSLPKNPLDQADSKLEKEEVELIYHIKDYEKSQIKRITFLSKDRKKDRFSDEKLKSVFRETKEGSLFSLFGSSGTFKDSSFKQDLQILTYWYLDHGYIKFRHETPVINISDDKKWIYISIYIEEGEQYEMDQIDFSGDLLFSKEELMSELLQVKGETFSVSKRNADILKLTEKYQDLGYAFVNVIPQMNIHDETKKVDVNYQFEKGNLAYFGKITILGNDKTHDQVIRRALKVHEGELFNGSRMRESREDVERLGYFAPGEVVFNTITPEGKTDIVDLEITIKERSTGSVNFGAGYGSFQKVFLSGQVSENNLFGRGQNLSLAAQYSIQQVSQSINLGFTEPYTFNTLWSSGFDIFYVKIPFPNRFINSRLGFDVRFGHPITDYIHGYITYKLEGLQDLNPDESVSKQALDEDTGLLSSVTMSVVRDKRNNRFETTGGNYQSFSWETAGLGGDMKFMKGIFDSRFYQRIIGDLVFRHKFEIGHMFQIGDRNTPPSQRFYLGGPNNMRGYQIFLLGPVLVDSAGRPQPQGALYEAFTIFELEYPLIREAGIKFVTFFDAGNAWWPGDQFILRADVGFGFRWFSPMGPLRFEWGFPLNRRTIDDTSQFQFMMGSPF